MLLDSDTSYLSLLLVLAAVAEARDTLLVAVAVVHAGLIRHELHHAPQLTAADGGV